MLPITAPITRPITGPITSPDTDDAIAALFANGEPGAAHVVGDFARYTAPGPERVSNGDFSSGATGWTVGTGWAITGGAAVATSANTIFSQGAVFTSGKWYRITFQFSYTSGTLQLRNDGVQNIGFPSSIGSGTITYYVLATVSGALEFVGTSLNASVDNVSVRELTAIDTATMFTDSAGTTPVVSVEQQVGLILDTKRGYLIGAQLVSNGDFSNGLTGWTPVNDAGCTTVVTAGQLVMTTTTNSAARIRQQISVVAGRSYLVSFLAQVTNTVAALTISDAGWGVGTIYFSGTAVNGQSQAIVTATTNSFYLQAQTFSNVAGLTGTFDNISVRELPGAHAIQPTAGSRAWLRNRYNQLTWSEDFTNAAWAKTAATITANAATAPDGTLTADKMIATAAAGAHGIAAVPTFGNNERVTAYVRAKAGEYVFLRLLIGGAGWNAYCAYNLSTGVRSSVSTNNGINVGADITPAGDGYYLCSVTATPVAGASCSNLQIDINNSIDPNDASFTGNGTNGLFIWGADVRRTIDAVYPYQWIRSATDYDSDPLRFPVYLEADGVATSMYTPANLDLSGTDKVTVFAAITKLSDSATAVAIEHGGTGTYQTLLMAPGAVSGTGMYRTTLRDGVNVSEWYSAAGFTAPTSNVISLVIDRAQTTPAAQILARVNGVIDVNTPTGVAVTGAFGNLPLYLMARNAAGNFFRGRFYASVIRGALTPVSRAAAVEQQLNVQALGKVY
jgi:hypothetical protein